MFAAEGQLKGTRDSRSRHVRERACDGPHRERVISTEGERKLSLLRMLADSFRNRLRNSGHQTGVFEFANGWIGLRRDILKLVMAVKLDLPAELLELINEACVDEMNGSSVDTGARLGQGSSGNSRWISVG